MHRLWVKRCLSVLAILAGCFALAYGAFVFALALHNGEGDQPRVTVVRPIPPYPPAPSEENGAAGELASTVEARENLPEVIIGRYTVRLEPAVDYPPPFEVGRAPSFANTMTIWRDGKKLIEENFAEALDPHMGMDITGDGYPDAILHIFTFGAHCCFHTKVYSLGPAIEVIPAGGYSNCQGEFRDLDGDGVYEYLACDDTFAYRYCPFYDSPLVRVVLKFVPGKGYVPASPEFPEIYEEDIARHTQLAEMALGEGPFPDKDGTPKCAVLALVLDYLYSGETEQAQAALYHYYRYPDADAFWADILSTAQKSTYYVGPPVHPSRSDLALAH